MKNTAFLVAIIFIVNSALYAEAPKGEKCVGGKDPVDATCSCVWDIPDMLNHCTVKAYEPPQNAHLEPSDDPKQHDKLYTRTFTVVTSWDIVLITPNNPNKEIYKCDNKKQEQVTFQSCI